MKRSIVGVCVGLLVAASAQAQVVINPSPVPTCSAGQTLLYDGASWGCGSTAGVGTITGGGTSAKLPKWSGAQALTDSICSESAAVLTCTGSINATTAIQLNGTSINTAGTLTNVAYLNAANVFTGAQSITSGGLSVTNTVTHGTALANAVYNTPVSQYWNIDSDNDATGEVFQWGTNRNSATGGTLLMTLTDAGLLKASAYGAGTATFDASGNITSVSDARYKDRIAALPYGLADVLQLRPVQYGYNAISGLERDHLYGGFLAQDVQAVMPLAIGVDARGYLTLSERPILGAVVNGLQELAARIATLEAKLAKGGGD